VVDADLSKFFDTTLHSDLLKLVTRRIAERNVLWLIKQWSKALVEEGGRNGGRDMSAGKNEEKGIPQGGVITP